MQRALLFSAAIFVVSSGLKCLDNAGNPVDFWFMYKLPNGYDFAYVDPSTGDAQQPLQLFERPMNDESNPVALVRTLLALAEKGGTLQASPGSNRTQATDPQNSYLLYNDEPDTGTASSSYGHTKGVLSAAGTEGGLWIVHSTPKFPASTGKAQFYFPETEIIYGQTFLCLSLSKSEIDTVGQQLLLNKPYIYHKVGMFADVETTAAQFPNLGDVLRGNWNTEGGTGVQKLNVGSELQTFTSFAKNAQWNDDLYENLIAKHYSSGFLVETWLRGEEIGPYCPPSSPFRVVDAKTLSVVDGTQNRTWTESQDHAKWAVALDSSYVVCVGDINRMTSQRKRGGGAVCFSNRNLCYSLYNTVTTSDVCSGSSGKVTRT